MQNTDPRIDEYIDNAADFAKPILIHIRKLVHKGCPGVEETIKWKFPHFDYKGIICDMAAFKSHCTFGFKKAAIMSDPDKIFYPADTKAMGQFGRITKLSDLPPDKVLTAYIKEAAKLNEDGIKPRKPIKLNPLEIPVPEFISASLKKNAKVLKIFKAFSASHKKEYIGWITEAKTEQTRTKRLKQAIEWMAEGKDRNWKYRK